MKSAAGSILTSLAGAIAGVILALAAFGRENVTLVSLSPDDRMRVRIVERNDWLDRIFEVRLEDLSEGSSSTLFQSPDEGRPVGSERIVWSPDSRRFALLGRHFYHLGEGAAQPDGESLYLVYDLDSGKLRCNSRQQATYPPVDEAEVKWIRPDRTTGPVTAGPPFNQPIQTQPSGSGPTP